MRSLLFTLTFLISGVLHGQDLVQVQFNNGSVINYFAILTDNDVLIRISDDGKLLEWGTEVQSFRNNTYYAPRLQPYPGRIEYYGLEADSLNRGKVKTVASSSITYFNQNDTELKKGKIRSIGRLVFEYFDQYDNKTVQGKIRSIGGTNFQYYTNFDDKALTGKLRSVGNTSLNYYTSFDDKLIRGKIKTIGPVSYIWYTSMETQYGGGLKSGPFRASVAGVTYIIQ